MALDTPLVGGSSGGHLWQWRISAVVVSSVMAILLAGFLLMDPFHAGGVSGSAESLLMQAPKTVSNVLQLHVNPTSVEQVNELLERLPVHNVEDLVFQHIKPHAQHIYRNFLRYYGSTAPHFRTGQKFAKSRHMMKDKDEFTYRLGVFTNFIRDAIGLNNFEAFHNPRSDRAVFGVTKFADWTFEEFQTLLKGPATKLNTTINNSSKTIQDKAHLKQSVKQTSQTTPPCTTNWAAKFPFLFEAREQGNCRSCYAFAAAEAIRTHAYINTGIDQGFLSVQYILDCSDQGNGCIDGGYAGDVMDWVKQMGGIPRKAEYGSYLAASEGQCKADTPKAVTTMGSESFYEEETTANKLCSSGPLSMGVYTNNAWQAYKSGVLSHHSCKGANETNHDTQVVGLLEDRGAWLIRNTWGRDWGVNATTLKADTESEGGFILLEYGHNACYCTGRNSFPKNVTCVGSCTDHV